MIVTNKHGIENKSTDNIKYNEYTHLLVLSNQIYGIENYCLQYNLER